MRKRLLLVLMITQLHTGFAQQYRLSLNGGINASFVPAFQNNLSIAKRSSLIGQELLYLNQGSGSFFAPGSHRSATKPGAGFYVDGSVDRRLRNNWTVSISLGLNRVAFRYDAEQPDNNPLMKQAQSVLGDIRLLYLNSRFLNVTKQWGRFEAQAGPVISYLIHKKYTRNVSFYGEEESKPVVYTIGDDKGAAQKLLAGADLAVYYRVMRNLNAGLRGQRYFTPVYQKEQTGEDRYKKGKPLQLSLGLSYRLAGFK